MNQTQEKILEVALELFNEKGFSNVTMREIAATADIAVGNVTYYYHQKSDMIPDLITDPVYLSRENSKTLADFFRLISEMLDTLIDKRFFFRNNDLLVYNKSFSKDYVFTQERVLLHLENNIAELINQGVLIPLSQEEVRSISWFMLSQHMIWVTNTLTPFNSNVSNKSEALLLHVYFIKHLVTKSHQEELSVIEDELKNGRFV